MADYKYFNVYNYKGDWLQFVNVCDKSVSLLLHNSMDAMMN